MPWLRAVKRAAALTTARVKQVAVRSAAESTPVMPRIRRRLQDCKRYLDHVML